MRKLLIVFILVNLAGIRAYCQVDTLQLEEIGVLESPLWILEHYFVDLDNDGRKEIITCTVYNIHVYDSETFEELWTSPTLHIPTHLIFEDLNLDGLIDIAAEDDYHVYLFDPHASVTLWTSPPLDNLYACYAVGDRNEDGWGDVVMVSNEVFWRYDDCLNLDTAWVEVFDGPFYEDPETTVVLLPNIDCYFLDIWHRIWTEKVIEARLIQLSGSQGLEPSIVLYSRRDTVLMMEGAPISLGGITGQIVVINGLTLGEIYSVESGLKLYDVVAQSDNEQYIYAAGYNAWGLPLAGDVNLLAGKFGANSFVSFGNIHHWIWVAHHFWDWEGCIIGEIYTENAAYEICYGADDTLYVQGLIDIQPLWTLPNEIGLREVLFVVNDPRIFSDPQVVCKVSTDQFEFRFYDGADGTLDGILFSPPTELTKTTDLEGDGVDEIIGHHSRWLYIYHIGIGTGLEEHTPVPGMSFLNANYPNPFNSTTTIEFGLQEAGHVRIEVYDLLGRKVKTLIDKEMQAGSNLVVWDASAYSSGVYFYHIEAGDFIETRRMVYLK